jgi:hypothetical protein
MGGLQKAIPVKLLPAIAPYFRSKRSPTDKAMAVMMPYRVLA